MGSSNQKVAKNLNQKDYDQLIKSTKLTKDTLQEMYLKFRGKKDTIDRMQFNKLYYSLRQEPKERLIKITELIFSAFDKDKNGIKHYYSVP